MSVPENAKEDLLLSCRYGDLEDVQAFIKKFGADSLAEIRDQSENSILHMISANGHIGRQANISFGYSISKPISQSYWIMFFLSYLRVCLPHKMNLAQLPCIGQH